MKSRYKKPRLRTCSSCFNSYPLFHFPVVKRGGHDVIRETCKLCCDKQQINDNIARRYDYASAIRKETGMRVNHSTSNTPKDTIWLDAMDIRILMTIQKSRCAIDGGTLVYPRVYDPGDLKPNTTLGRWRGFDPFRSPALVRVHNDGPWDVLNTVLIARMYLGPCDYHGGAQKTIVCFRGIPELKLPTKDMIAATHEHVKNALYAEEQERIEENRETWTTL